MTCCDGYHARLAGMSNIELLPGLAGAPIACSLDGAQLGGRVDAFRALFVWLLSAERSPTGYRWIFQAGPGVERRVRELARSEHTCCPFLSFAVSTQGDHVIWESHGSDSAQDAVEALFALSQSANSEPPALERRPRAEN